jgi:hypothetical protein
MTGTGDMELLEREPSLALLAGYAAEAGRGEGRLVLLDGEAGVGKTALVERFQRDLPGTDRAGPGDQAVPAHPGRHPNRNAAAAQAARHNLF